MNVNETFNSVTIEILLPLAPFVKSIENSAFKGCLSFNFFKRIKNKMHNINYSYHFDLKSRIYIRCYMSLIWNLYEIIDIIIINK